MCNASCRRQSATALECSDWIDGMNTILDKWLRILSSEQYEGLKKERGFKLWTHQGGEGIQVC